MSCKYCDIKMRSLDEDTKVLKGESWKDDEFGEGGYIGPSHGGKFRMVVDYDAGYASTEVPDVKFCPFCGGELKLPNEPLIKDEKIRKAIRAWAEANGIERVWHEYSSCWLRCNGLKIELENDVDELKQGNYSIDELCGEEEE